jgi:hypothetical protein
VRGHPADDLSRRGSQGARHCTRSPAWRCTLTGRPLPEETAQQQLPPHGWTLSQPQRREDEGWDRRRSSISPTSRTAPGCGGPSLLPPTPSAPRRCISSDRFAQQLKLTLASAQHTLPAQHMPPAPRFHTDPLLECGERGCLLLPSGAVPHDPGGSSECGRAPSRDVRAPMRPFPMPPTTGCRLHRGVAVPQGRQVCEFSEAGTTVAQVQAAQDAVPSNKFARQEQQPVTLH